MESAPEIVNPDLEDAESERKRRRIAERVEETMNRIKEAHQSVLAFKKEIVVMNEKLSEIEDGNMRAGRWIYEPLNTSRWEAAITWLESAEYEATLLFQRYIRTKITRQERKDLLRLDIGDLEGVNYLKSLKREAEARAIIWFSDGVEQSGSFTSLWLEDPKLGQAPVHDDGHGHGIVTTKALFRALRYAEKKLAKLWGRPVREVHEMMVKLITIKSEFEEISQPSHTFDWRLPKLSAPFDAGDEGGAEEEKRSSSVSLRTVRAQLDICGDILEWGPNTLRRFFLTPCYTAALRWYMRSLRGLAKACLTEAEAGCLVSDHDDALRSDSHHAFHYIRRMTNCREREWTSVERTTGRWWEESHTTPGGWKLLDEELLSSYTF